MERLRCYVAHNAGLTTMRYAHGKLEALDEAFAGRTLEHLTGPSSAPHVLFAAVAFDGAYRTRNAGKSWEKILDGDVRAIAIDPHDERLVYAGAGPVRLFRSADGGTTWEPLDGLLAVSDEVKAQWGVPGTYVGTEVPHVRHIFVHPDDAMLLVVLIEHGGVLFRRDGGQTWVDRSAGIGYLDMHVIENYPGSTERYFVSSARGFFRTEDAGVHWVRAEDGMPWTGTERYCYSHEWRFLDGENGTAPRMIVCGGRGSPGVWAREQTVPQGHILLSDDAGAHWRPAARGLAENPWMPWVLARHPGDSQTLFCGLGDGGRGFRLMTKHRGNGAIFITHDAGESWDPLVEGCPSVLTAWVAPE
jgi:hypothetical protein